MTGLIIYTIIGIMASIWVALDDCRIDKERN